MEIAVVQHGNQVDWGALSQAKVVDVMDVTEHSLLSLYPPHEGGSGTILVFLADYSSSNCLLQVASFSYAINELLEIKARVVFIGGGNVPTARKFQGKVSKIFRFPGEFYVDEDMSTFSAAALQRGTSVRGITSNLKKLGIKSVFDGVKTRVENRKLSSANIYQGGTLVIRTDRDNPHFRPELLFACVGRAGVDAIPISDILRACGHPDPPEIAPATIMSAYHLKRHDGLSRTGSDDSDSQRASSLRMAPAAKPPPRPRFMEDRGESVFV